MITPVAFKHPHKIALASWAAGTAETPPPNPVGPQSSSSAYRSPPAITWKPEASTATVIRQAVPNSGRDVRLPNIYTPLVHKLGMLKFVVWDKGLVQNDYLGGKSLPINDWFKGTVFTFNDPNNRRPKARTTFASSYLRSLRKGSSEMAQQNKFTPNSDIGEAEIDIASLVERVRTKDLNTGLHAYSVSTIREFSLPQSPPKKPGRLMQGLMMPLVPSAGYQPYDTEETGGAKSLTWTARERSRAESPHQCPNLLARRRPPR
ncbi:hypothetical protein EDB86DRAFT_2831894 [Lactarius hatsudake]|nr:hypothetical protein EDB86DRAFT_2831894 [Lactarius hatsudake]